MADFAALSTWIRMLVAKLENMEASTDCIRFYVICNHNGRLVRRFAEVFCIFWVRFGVILIPSTIWATKNVAFSSKMVIFRPQIDQKSKIINIEMQK